MQWFEGDIGSAINSSKQKNATFVVFVYGNDGASTKTLEAINSSEVSTKLGSKDFVAIKLESGSQPYHQFVQIYQLVPVPSLFFIGQSGVPLAVVPGEASKEVLLENIHKVLGSEGPVAQASTSSTPVTKESSLTSREAPNPPEIPPVRESTPPAAAETSQESQESLQERIKKADQVRVALAAKKQREEEEQEREREQIRRREGQELAQAKRAREAVEAQQALEERKREREMEKEARERVLKQIEQDKRERAARIAAEKNTSPPPMTTSVTPTPAPVPATAARLQFRLPDGSSNTNVFQPSDTLGDVRKYVRSNLYPQNFSLSMAFPRAELAVCDDARSLQDLGLCPSAALLVLPPTSSSGSTVAAPGGGLFGLLMMILSPFALVWSFISARIWGTGDSSPGAPTHEGPGPVGPAGAAAQARASQNEVRHRVRREGNIHRLAGSQDPDDENNTYNGNSTQQM